jgi:hypothetical protein
MAYDEKTAERVRKVLSGRSDLVEKKLMGGLCFMVAGGMCCAVSGRGGLLVRVGPQVREWILGEPHVRPVAMRGRTVKGFVRIDPEGYRTDAALRKWITFGLEFVATLPAEGSGRKARRKPVKRGPKG